MWNTDGVEIGMVGTESESAEGVGGGEGAIEPIVVVVLK